MKRVLLALILISPMSYADWGDTYFCTATHHSRVDLDGKRTTFKLQDFTFHLSKEKNAMVFDNSENFFKYTVIGLSKLGSFPNLESWSAEDVDSKVVFMEGKFAHGFVTGRGVTVNTATCQRS
ncbi:MAG: hypothetical protein ACKVH9_05870 [Rhodobacterales bacterium]